MVSNWTKAFECGHEPYEVLKGLSLNGRIV